MIMNNIKAKLLLTLLNLYILLAAVPAAADMSDDPLLLMTKINELERYDAGADPLSWDADIWLGKDLHKFWLKTSGERNDSGTATAEVQALYSRAFTPFWDLQLGVRADLQPDPQRNWAVIGLQGTAPYYFEIDTALFIGEDGRSALRFEAEYELLFTQKLILSPQLEFNLYGKDDPELGIGSGLAQAEVGLRLRYELRREFAPYVGLHREKVFGQTADFRADESTDTRWLIGLQAWF
jgi:copper resistance protein B